MLFQCIVLNLRTFNGLLFIIIINKLTPYFIANFPLYKNVPLISITYWKSDTPENNINVFWKSNGWKKILTAMYFYKIYRNYIKFYIFGKANLGDSQML